jgi:hypothetical protein
MKKETLVRASTFCLVFSLLAACSDDNAPNGGQSSTGANSKVSCELLDGTCLSLEESACLELVKNGKANLLAACPSDNHGLSSSANGGNSSSSGDAPSIPSLPSGEGDLDTRVAPGEYAPYSGNGKMWLAMFECESIEIGTVVNGKMTYTLPAPAPNCFIGVSEDFEDVNYISRPTTLQFTAAGFVLDSLYETGYARQDRLMDKLSSEVWLMPFYFSEAGFISGSDGEVSVEITAKAGWNWIAFYEQEGDDQGNGHEMLITSDLSKLPSDMKWIADMD